MSMLNCCSVQNRKLSMSKENETGLIHQPPLTSRVKSPGGNNTAWVLYVTYSTRATYCMFCQYI